MSCWLAGRPGALVSMAADRVVRDHSSVPRNMARAPAPPSLAFRDRPETANQRAPPAREQRDGHRSLGWAWTVGCAGWVGRVRLPAEIDIDAGTLVSGIVRRPSLDATGA